MEPDAEKGGQRLRWWTQESTAPKSNTSVHAAAPAQTIAPTELWEELEAEAKRRAELEQDAVVIEGDAVAFQKKRNRIAYTFIAGMSFLLIALGIWSHRWVYCFAPIIFILEALLLTQMAKKMNAGPKPTIHLSSVGITVDLPSYRLGPVFWEEIASLGIRKAAGVEFLQINLKDPAKTLGRALHMKNTPVKNLAAWAARRKPIAVPLAVFQASAQEIVAQMATFRPGLPKS